MPQDRQVNIRQHLPRTGFQKCLKNSARVEDFCIATVVSDSVSTFSTLLVHAINSISIPAAKHSSRMCNWSNLITWVWSPVVAAVNSKVKTTCDFHSASWWQNVVQQRFDRFHKGKLNTKFNTKFISARFPALVQWYPVAGALQNATSTA